MLSITVRDDGEGSNTLVIQDNGIGIEYERLDKVLTEIGRSSSYKQGDEAGQFGMGFISVFKLVGMDGGVTMKTRSRETDEVIAGVFTNAGFNRYEDLETAETPYGTRFEIPVKDDISASELDSWVKELCQFTRVNVAYERVNCNGTVVECDEIPKDMPRKFLRDRYNKSTCDEIYFVEPDEFDNRIRDEFDDVERKRINDIATLYYDYRMEQLSEEKKELVESTFREAYYPTVEDVRKTFDILES